MSSLNEQVNGPSILGSLTDVPLLDGSENSLSPEDEDVFQCGKCKENFTSLSAFLSHKKEVCVKKNGISYKNFAPHHENGIQERTNLISAPSSSSTRLLADSNSLLSSNMIHISENDYLSLATNLDMPQKNFNLCDNLLNSDSLSLLTASSPLTNGCELETLNASSLSPTSSTTLGFPVSFLANNASLLPSSGSLLLTTSSNASTNEGSEDIDLSSITLPSNILLNITSPVICNAQETSAINSAFASSNHVSDAAHGKSSPSPSNSSNTKDEGVVKKNQDAGINILPHSDIKLTTVQENDSKEAVDASKQEFTATSNGENGDNNSTNSVSTDGKKQPKLKCNFCDRVSNKNFDLQQHIRCHTGEKPFQCIVCGRAFAQKSNVKKHMQTHKVWPDGLANTLPLLTTGGSRSSDDISDIGLSTSLESESLTDSTPLEKFINDFKETGPIDSSYACPYCSFTGRTYFELKSHMKSHKREKVYKCIQSSCGKMFAELEPFLEHIQSHENEMTYSCHQCSKTFNSLCELGDHQYSHTLVPNQGNRTGQRYYRCSKCLNKYTTSAALEHHIATTTHHYPCPHCNKVFPCERYLRRHLLTHGSGLHMCQFCDKTFKTANYLKVHLVIHTGEKPYACNICNAAFNRRDKLKRHKLVHDPVKRFKCPLRAHTGCSKEFNRHDKLKAHMLTHCGIKPHECAQCGRAFSRRAHLRAHMNAHNNNRVPTAS